MRHAGDQSSVRVPAARRPFTMYSHSACEQLSALCSCQVTGYVDNGGLARVQIELPRVSEKDVSVGYPRWVEIPEHAASSGRESSITMNRLARRFIIRRRMAESLAGIRIL